VVTRGQVRTELRLAPRIIHIRSSAVSSKCERRWGPRDTDPGNPKLFVAPGASDGIVRQRLAEGARSQCPCVR